MGAIHNNSKGSRTGPASGAGLSLRSRLGGSVVLLSAMLVIPAASVADPTPAQQATTPSPAASEPAKSVSMSPDVIGERPNTTISLTSLEGDQTSRPLTRAAAQLRLETMSPADWLAGFGEVTVGRINTDGRK